ncbi:MAG: cytochrome c oxidase subunit II [Chloroflexota bacterium]|jgi:cytochrome c oxidase subunit 2
MNQGQNSPNRRVLIASANPLFGQGLQKMILRKWKGLVVDIRLVESNEAVLEEMKQWSPQLIILDYDDKNISRSEFLQQFVIGDQPMQVMLVSLQSSGAVVVYDRRTLTPAQVEDWLSLPDLSASESSDPLRKRSSLMRHVAIVSVLVVVFTALVYLFLTNVGLLPMAASEQAQPIDELFNLHFLMIAFLFSLITVFLGYSLVVFRRKPGEEGDGAYFKGNNPLEVVWTVIPLGIVIYFAYLGSVSLAETRRVDPQALEIKVVGGQWFWRFEYPDYGIVSNEMVMPVNKQAVLKMTSLDVIHSFWVPEFRVKQDLLPGENFVRELRITPTELGEFKVRCAEMCGTSHAYMESPVVVVSQSDFEQWAQDQLAALGADPVARGEVWARNNGCFSCHSVDGSPNVGPTWKGLFGKQQELTDGSVVLVDDDYLRLSIVNPNAQVPAGFVAGVMPQIYQDTIPDTQILEMIEYIKSLQ